MDKKEIYTITQFYEMLGVSDATIKKYEKDYKLKIPQNELGHRYYTTKEIEVFNQIILFKEQGANIHVIKKILSRSVNAEKQNKQEIVGETPKA